LPPFADALGGTAIQKSLGDLWG